MYGAYHITSHHITSSDPGQHGAYHINITSHHITNRSDVRHKAQLLKAGTPTRTDFYMGRAHAQATPGRCAALHENQRTYAKASRNKSGSALMAESF